MNTIEERHHDPDTGFTRRITYANNVASFGAEITEHDPEFGHYSTMQLANPRGTMTLLFALKVEDGWSSISTVTNPERFMDKPPTTADEWQVVIAKWNAHGDHERSMQGMR